MPSMCLALSLLLHRFPLFALQVTNFFAKSNRIGADQVSGSQTIVLMNSLIVQTQRQITIGHDVALNMCDQSRDDCYFVVGVFGDYASSPGGENHLRTQSASH